MTILSPISRNAGVASAGRIVRVVWMHETPPPHEFVAVACPEDDGGYSIFARNYPGIISQGDSLAEAESNIAEAFIAMLEARRKHHEEMLFSQGPALDIPANARLLRIRVNG
jgi:predicted RNase H-like HicB family nuclease